ncbi:MULTISPECIES: hypothetical protein [Moraxella]|uniref:hypothetical protein n=1 Tax=Moraxella TaxID=475 RepID=UPI0012DDC460|nr:MULTISPECIES: hypothetical protein [Moraxella]MBE9579287.1 hypothetical protein [Moraxella sp. K1664]MBE9588676.1 hypothetical protein [Moraxella sp. K1630]MBE9590619.1 hypothetical protein [Moraxella sp. K127]MBE9596837.1 hypothetical protein [Moraxella sp. K2450]MDH9219362.1 hypothetical protein [Moraxella lacunata]
MPRKELKDENPILESKEEVDFNKFLNTINNGNIDKKYDDIINKLLSVLGFL